ncbi:hypothetical protein PTT_01919, partial [Pyrenophora teres f. teres 0-1]
MRLILWRSERARPDSLLTTTSSNEDIKYRQRAASGRAFDVQTNSSHPARGRNSSIDASIKNRCLHCRQRLKRNRLTPFPAG